MSVRVLHCADVHLGRSFAHLGEAGASRRQDLLDTFDHICDIAMEQGVAALLIGGDLFDVYNPSSTLVSMVQEQFRRLGSAGIRVFVIPGDHDSVWYERSVWRRNAFDNAHVFREPTFAQPRMLEAGGQTVHVHGLAFNQAVCPRPLETLRLSESGINLVMIHGTVDPPFTMPVEQRYYSLLRHELFNAGAHFVALGHAHKQQTYESAGQVVAAYPGTPEGLDQSETGRRFVTLIELGGAKTAVSFLPVNGREVRVEKFDVTDHSTEDVVETLRASSAYSVLLTAIFTGRPAELLDVDQIRSRLAHDYFWLQIDDQTQLAGSEFAQRLASEATIVGGYVSSFRSRIEATKDPAERARLEYALKLGLSALKGRSAS